MTDPAQPPLHRCEVFAARDLRVTTGVNVGDALGGVEETCLGDICRLGTGAAARRLSLIRDRGRQTVAGDSAVGLPGAPISVLARHTMMAPDGDRVQVLVLRQTAPDADFILPMSPLGAAIPYTLVQVEEAAQDAPLADLLCVSFARGTSITLGGGTQCPVERLEPGMRVLTRDHGPQPLRWLGRATLRGHGAFAPVVIGAGTLGNSGDLVVSQHHRMFLYLRERGPEVARAELLVQARHLVDGEAVYLREGGVVDWFSLIFERHEIVYAEGIRAESLLVTEATLSRLPEPLAAEVKRRFPTLSHVQHVGLEAGREIAGTLGRTRP